MDLIIPQFYSECEIYMKITQTTVMNIYSPVNLCTQSDQPHTNCNSNETGTIF